MGRKSKIKIGEKFNLLTVLSETESHISPCGSKTRKVLCECSCGNVKSYSYTSVKTGHTKSCGCYRNGRPVKKSVYLLNGDRYGRLVVLEEVPFEDVLNKGKRREFKCICDCGNETIAMMVYLRNGDKKSCGCIGREKVIERNKKNTKHGMRNHPMYSTFNRIVSRTSDKNNKDFASYGGRGIFLFKDWRDTPKPFIDYVSNLENYGKKGYTLDRINNDKGYEPDNLRWATRKTQAKNRRSSIFINMDGIDYNIPELSIKFNIPESNLYVRYHKGQNIVDYIKSIAS